MSENGDKLAAAYRALPREEPGAAVDAAILAASRRALAKPSASRRWAGPMSIAAVLVLAFGVTLHMREEKPGVESPDMYSAPAPAAATAQAPAASPPPARSMDALQQPKLAEAKPEPPQKRAKVAVAAKPDANAPREAEARRESFRDEATPERKDLAQAEPAQSLLRKESDMKLNQAPAAPAAGALAARMKREAPIAEASGMRAADAQVSMDEPTRELEAIAKLRAEGRNEDADKALAEFRRKRPDYRIADAMWERVKPR